jgi:hypothetical protein
VPSVTVPPAPALARLDRVELAHAGTWNIALGGSQTFTGDDFAAAIAALDCPAIRRPIVKLGHQDSRGPGVILPGDDGNRDGEPALGWVANMGITDGRRTLVGDLVGMPGWLGQIAASAYPDRSIEGCRDYVCQIGHRHPFVISAVALLGVTPPGVGTLGSLQDHVRALYGVAAAPDPDVPAGEPFAVTFHASHASTESIVTAQPWVRYASRAVSRAVAAGPPDPPTDPPTGPAEEGQPAADPPTDPATPPEPGGVPVSPAAEPEPPAPENEEDPVSTQSEIRSRLGLPEDADDAAVLAALDARVAPATGPTEPPAPDPVNEPEPATPELVAAAQRPTLPDGVVTVEASALAELQRNARLGAEAHERQRIADRDTYIAAAQQAGKFAPHRRDHWVKSWEADPDGTKATLDGLEPGLVVPVAASGRTGSPDEDANAISEAESAEWARHFGIPKGALL